ncbi:MAG: glycerophosphoryl diester phosphodiesterase membrane domain-containing protein [Candidatus Cloacimonetes bacterium]|nr:glycerophosphoryl diester phosphodiesterase membrane domain-containing protein [Candidatus Cloacimonadota bacterium]
MSLFIRAGGYEILVNGEIAKFLLSFTGILMILIVLTLSVVLIYYEFSVILLILDNSKKKEKIKLLKNLMRNMKNYRWDRSCCLSDIYFWS